MVTNKDIPTLTGKEAERFIQKVEENSKNKGTVNFKEAFENSMAIIRKKSQKELISCDTTNNNNRKKTTT